jgi:uncharacterized protein YpmS
MATKKEGSGTAFWVIIIFLGIVIAFAAWFFLKREEKPVKANPAQTSSLQFQTSSLRPQIPSCA